jgi:FMN phosphatase YigB (HAD superfamily)
MVNNLGGWEDIIFLIGNESIKHLSFDFWNTIVYPNPQFKDKRAQLIAQYLDCGLSKYEINAAFSFIGKEYNDYQQSDYAVIQPLDLLKSVIEVIKPNVDINIIKLYNEINAFFIQYPPVIEPQFYVILDLLTRKEKTCSITSNTAFIPGSVIVEYLKNCNIFHHFSFTIFSNDFGFGKPSSKIFDYLFNKARENNSNIEKNNILHIGDNLESDFRGAIKSNLAAFHLLDNKNSKYNTIVLHLIKDITAIPFSPDDYSKFKYGSHEIAQKFGKDLFEYFKSNHLNEVISKFIKIIVYSSPYMQIPTSSYYLTHVFFEAFKQHVAIKRIKHIKIEFGKIERCQTYTDDYGSLTSEERFNLIKNDTYKLITVPDEDDLCIFIDDISITGTHQRVVEQLLLRDGIKANIIFLYFAKLSNPQVSPSFENYLNYHYINDFSRLFELIVADDYRITTRTAKYILSQKLEELTKFVNVLIKKEKYATWSELIIMSYANEYNKIEVYQPSLFYLESCFKKYNHFNI